MFGSVLDPFADKCMIAVLTVALAISNLLPRECVVEERRKGMKDCCVFTCHSSSCCAHPGTRFPACSGFLLPAIYYSASTGVYVCVCVCVWLSDSECVLL